MKFQLLTLFLLLSFLKINGQETIIAKNKNEVGFNMSAVVNSVFDIGVDPAQPDFNLFYRSISSKGFAYRFGGLLSIKNSKTNVDITNPNTVELKNSRVGFRFGIEQIVKVGSKFEFVYGGDLLAIIGSNKSLSNGGSFKISNNITSFGLGPALRFQWLIAHNVSLVTESTAYLTFDKEKRKNEFTGNPSVESEDSFVNFSTRIPTTLFLCFRF